MAAKVAIAGTAENPDIKQRLAGVEKVENKARKGMREKEEAKPWAGATVKSLEANLQAKARERRAGVPMGSKATATIAASPGIVRNGARKERVEPAVE